MITAAALLIITLLYLAFTMDRAWSNVTQPERNELVFEGRHRGYGAYQLRKEYDHRLVIAFILTIGLLALLAAVPKVISWFTPPIAVAPPIPPVIIVDFIPPSTVPDAPLPTKPKPTVAPITPRAATSLVVPVDSILIPPPDTMHTDAVATITSPLGNAGGETTGSDSARTSALIGGPTRGHGPFDGSQVDELPVFPGGDAALGPWMQDHLEFPQGLNGKDLVYVQFTVDGAGKVTDARAISGEHAQCKDAATRTVARMPIWKPARMNGHDVPCRLTLPIRFEVH